MQTTVTGKLAKMTDFKKVSTKTKFSETQYYSVDKIVGGEIQLKNSNGGDIVVDRGYVEKYLTSADQFTEERNITRTEAAQIFVNSTNIVLTVNFNKQVKEADVTKEIMDAVSITSISGIEQAVKKAVKRALDGEERTLVGYHSGNVDDFGRVSVTDMEIETGYNLRLVDPRTLNWMIINNVKYKIK